MLIVESTKWNPSRMSIKSLLCLSVCLFVCLSVCLSDSQTVNMSVCPSDSQSISQSVCPFEIPYFSLSSTTPSFSRGLFYHVASLFLSPSLCFSFIMSLITIWILSCVISSFRLSSLNPARSPSLYSATIPSSFCSMSYAEI